MRASYYIIWFLETKEERYDENEVFPNVEGVTVGTQKYRAIRREVYDRDIHDLIRANLVEHIYMAHIQPPTECWHDDLFDKLGEDLDMFVESEHSDDDDENDVDENDDEDYVDDEDDDSEWRILVFLKFGY